MDYNFGNLLWAGMKLSLWQDECIADANQEKDFLLMAAEEQTKDAMLGTFLLFLFVLFPWSARSDTPPRPVIILFVLWCVGHGVL